MASDPVVLVTGSSSGIGFETSLLLARNGYFTYASMRNLAKGKELKEIAKKEDLPIKLISLDVTKNASISLAVRRIMREKGRIDILVNSAGYVMFGCFEDASKEEFREQFETNFFGVTKTIRNVLPIMRKQHAGMILNIGSIAGRIGLPVASGYISAEFALEGLTESIRYELEPFGIRVCMVEPGMVRTNFLKSKKVAKKAALQSSPYYKITHKLMNSLGTMTDIGISPNEVAHIILKAIQSDKPLPRYVVGNDAAMILENRKSVSDTEFENFIKKTILNI